MAVKKKTSSGGLSTSEKLASANPAVRREGQAELSQQSVSQAQATAQQAEDISSRGYSGTVSTSTVQAETSKTIASISGSGGMSTAEKLASLNPTVRAEGMAEMAKLSPSQTSATLTRAKTYAGRGTSGTLSAKQFQESLQKAAEKPLPWTKTGTTSLGTPVWERQFYGDTGLITERAVKTKRPEAGYEGTFWQTGLGETTYTLGGKTFTEEQIKKSGLVFGEDYTIDLSKAGQQHRYMDLMGWQLTSPENIKQLRTMYPSTEAVPLGQKGGGYDWIMAAREYGWSDKGLKQELLHLYPDETKTKLEYLQTDLYNTSPKVKKDIAKIKSFISPLEKKYIEPSLMAIKYVFGKPLEIAAIPVAKVGSYIEVTAGSKALQYSSLNKRIYQNKIIEQQPIIDFNIIDKNFVNTNLLSGTSTKSTYYDINYPYLTKKYLLSTVLYGTSEAGTLIKTVGEHPYLTVGLGTAGSVGVIGKVLTTGLGLYGAYEDIKLGRKAVAGEIPWQEAVGRGVVITETLGTRNLLTKITGGYKSDIVVYGKGEKIPYMSRMKQTEELTTGKRIKLTSGLRYGELLLSKFSAKKARAPEEIGDVPSGTKGFFGSVKDYLAETGGYFLERRPFYERVYRRYKETKSVKLALKETYKLPSRIIQANYRTVKLEPFMREKLFKAMEEANISTLKSLQKEITETALQQSLQYKEPIAIPSPKRFVGVKQPESEAFIISAKPEFLTVTSKRYLGSLKYEGRTIAVSELRFGKQPRLKRDYYRLANIKFNVKNIFGKEYIKLQYSKAQRKLLEEYGGARKALGEYGGHGREHAEDVTAKILELKQKYPTALKKVTPNLAYYAGKYHDVAKVYEYETEPITHAKAASYFIRKGYFPELNKLSFGERLIVSKAIELHTTLQPTLRSRIINRPTQLAQALATADRIALGRFGTKVDVKRTFLPQFQRKEKVSKVVRKIKIPTVKIKPSKVIIKEIEKSKVTKTEKPRYEYENIKRYDYLKTYPKQYGYGSTKGYESFGKYKPDYGKVYKTVSPKYATYPEKIPQYITGKYTPKYSVYQKIIPRFPYTPKYPTEVIIPTITPPTRQYTILKQKYGKQKKYSFKQLERQTKYLPSLVAVEEKLYGRKIPETLTGLEVRYQIA